MENRYCDNCSNVFYVKPSWLKKGFGKFCSRGCQHKASRKGKEMPCYECGAPTYKQPKDLKRSKSKRYFCSKSCQTVWRNQLYIWNCHKNFTTGESTYRAAMKRSDKEKRCQHCKTNDFRVLAVHHVDKNRENNRLENLAWLCHNCHYLVHHYEGEREIFMAAIV